MLEAPRDAVGIDLDAHGDTAVQCHGQRLRPTHSTEPRGQRDRSRQRPSESLARHSGKRFVRPLQDALGPDVDPRARSHLAVHGQPECFEPAKLVPRRPLGHEHRVGDEHARSPFMRVEHADRLARLHEQGLVVAQNLQLADDRVERLPRSRCAARAAVDHEVLGPLGHRRVEVVHEHAHRGLLRPAAAGPFRSGRRVDDAAHRRRPAATSAAAMTSPLRTSAAAAASSGAITRSGPMPLMCFRTSARTAPVAGEGCSGHHQLDGEDRREVVDDRAQLQARAPAHRHMVLLHARRRDRVDAGRRGQAAVLRHERRRGVLGDHHPRVHARLLGKERRQTL